MSQARKILIHVSAWILVTSGSILVALVLFELMMQQTRKGAVAMRVAPASYGQVDDVLGIRYLPNTSVSYAYLDATGRVLECLPDISVTNSDGFRGLDTKPDYRTADHRVIVTGDSFSHWNNSGMTIVDHTKAQLNELVPDASLINVAGGTFGLEHMVVHAAAAIDEMGASRPQLVAIQFIKDDITRDWWYRKTMQDANGQSRARLAGSLECLATDSGCGSDEYLIEPRATQQWCEAQKGKESSDDISADLVASYKEIRGFFVYVRRVLARVGLIDRSATSVIPRVESVDASNTDRISRAIQRIRDSGADIALVYLPTVEEIKSGQIYEFTEIEHAVLRFYEERLGVPTIYPADYSAFDGVTNFTVSPFDRHPSIDLQRAYGKYLAPIFSNALRNHGETGVE